MLEMSGRLARGAADPLDKQSLAGRARSRRWNELSLRFPDIAEMHVLDLGGTPSSWTLAPVRPKHVTTVNLDPSDDRPGITHVVGDACALPSELATAPFDLVYSNSLIEHVGGHLQRQRFAETVHSKADLHWIQTPYRYFPIEPHWVFPGMQFLPFRARVWVSLNWRLGHLRSPSREAAVRDVSEVELISRTQMVSYFPDSKLWVEKFAGMPKSLVAVQPGS